MPTEVWRTDKKVGADTSRVVEDGVCLGSSLDLCATPSRRPEFTAIAVPLDQVRRILGGTG